MGRHAFEAFASRYMNKLSLVRDEATRAANPLKNESLPVKDDNSSDTFRCSSRSNSESQVIQRCPAEESTRRKAVSFSNVEIRNYSMVIGDHPCCTMGCPLSLGWDYQSSDVQNLEKYEEARTPRCTRDELRTTSEERRRMLAAVNVSDTDMRRAERRLHRARSCSAKLCERVSESFFSSM